MPRIPLSLKLGAIGFLLMASLVAVLGYLAISMSGDSLLRQQSESLTAVLASRRTYVQDYFGLLDRQVSIFARDPSIVDAVIGFSGAFRSVAGRNPQLEPLQATRLEIFYDEARDYVLGQGRRWPDRADVLPETPIGRFLQYHYLVDNPHTLSEKRELVAAQTATPYDVVHARYHRQLRDFGESFGFADLYLIDPDGNVIYSLGKGIEYATNLERGPYADSVLAKSFRLALDKLPEDSPVFLDFAEYTPNFGIPASFVAAPVYVGERRVGVVALQLPVDNINRIMADTAGLGTTGETFLVGKDGLMRTDSRFTEGSTVGMKRIDTVAVARALSGEAGTLPGLDYRDVPVLTAYGPLELPTLDWVIVAKQDLDEVTAPAQLLRRRLVGVGLTLAAVFCLVGFFSLRKAVLKPVRDLTLGVRELRRGDYEHRVDVSGQDELGELALGFNRMAAHIASDIDMRERFQDELAAKELQLRTLIENIPGVTYSFAVQDGKFVCKYMSDSVKDLTGYPPEYFVESPLEVFDELIHPEDREGVRAQLGAALSGERDEYRLEYRIIDRDGAMRWVMERTRIHSNTEGRPALAHGNIFDINERRVMEEELKRSEGKFRRIVEGLRSEYFFYTYGLDGKLTYVSPSVRDVLGFEPAVYGSSVTIWMTDNPINQALPDRLKRLFAGEFLPPQIFEFRHASGSPRMIETMSFPVLDDSGGVQYIEGIARDVSEVIRTQQDLREARDAAEQASRAKSAFLANMSHELRTPMNAIIGYSEMLTEEAEDAGSDDFVPDLERINEAGRHLLSLINDILDLSKVEAGRMELYVENFSVHDMVNDVLDSVRPQAEARNNQLQVNLDPDLVQMRGDVTKLRQCLANLLSNAVKFTEEGVVTLQLSQHDGFAEFVVTDTGIGIPPEKVDRLFEDFTQADASTTRKYGGTGLGLAITRRFVEMMQGSIAVQSVAGEGAVFTLRLPQNLDEAPLNEAAEAEGTGPANGTETSRLGCVVVIDDESSARELLSRTLRRSGYDVVQAASGREGFELAASLQPAAITLDVMMPGEDGWSVLSRLKQDGRTCDIPVVMVTIVDDPQAGLALGAADYLCKPVDREQLLSSVRRATTATGEALVVEDDSAMREWLQRTLAKDGWRVVTAEHGAAACEQLRERQPDVVFLDLSMPVMDGFELALLMRREVTWRDIPIIVVTAAEMTPTQREQLQGLAARVIAKHGMSQNEILEALQAALTVSASG